ncbi:hypothetical protein DRP04_00700 [Archaeoglobales archaeon]|nr:MAG: hypothetical protein DRP04_00700 [Archaeoglobales archaeon]
MDVNEYSKVLGDTIRKLEEIIDFLRAELKKYEKGANDKEEYVSFIRFQLSNRDGFLIDKKDLVEIYNRMPEKFTKRLLEKNLKERGHGRVNLKARYIIRYLDAIGYVRITRLNPLTAVKIKNIIDENILPDKLKF